MTYDQAIRDLLGIIGVALLGYGAWLHYPPLGFAVSGGALVLLTVAGTLRSRVAAEPRRLLE